MTTSTENLTPEPRNHETKATIPPEAERAAIAAQLRILAAKLEAAEPLQAL